MSKIQMWLCLSAAAVVSLIAAAFFINHAAYSRGYNAALAKVEKQAQVTKEKQQATATQSSKDYQTDKAAADKEAEIRYVEVQKIIERPVYINECLDASGVQLVNQAVGEH